MPTIPDLIETGLPKWPYLIMLGEKISEDNALEIIRRTDSFFSNETFGNSREYNRLVRRALNIPRPPWDMSKKESDALNWPDYFKRLEAWQNAWDYIRTKYVMNSWISHAHLFGAHGWCHPNGAIAHVDPVGKYPSVEEVRDDFEAIASAFPHLNFVAMLCDEGQDREPLVGFKVRNGEVRVINVTDSNLFERFGSSVETAYQDALRYCGSRDIAQAVDQLNNDRLAFFRKEIGIDFKTVILNKWRPKAVELGLVGENDPW